MPEASQTVTDSRLVRLGYHGSTTVVSDIIRLAGRDEAAVRLSEYDIGDPFAEVRAGRQDVMIAKFAVREPDLFTTRTLTEDARAVVVAADHPLAARDHVSVEDVAAYDCFDRPGDFPAYVWDEVVPPHTPAGRPLHRRHRVSTVPEMMRLVATGAGVHLSVISLADLAPAGVRVVPVHDLPPAPVTLAWPRERELPSHIRDFIAAAEQEAAR
ncbi:LysR family transcriptional regulator [Streptomyces sp. 5-8]|uniref:LysR family transcriptional regulator n=1 Tax=Streptomyces musisoli TaxID=2802280 RepID=A0ABS1NUL2_9ACTN|nr:MULTISPECIES: LysR substrate-binding domain-containing protein [Streptomyces]MBL1103495.1 LysR family transcriptional regulator [Streptomyces musisoli]MBY8839899.1 LysR family transcriptional regulator [Streptomyces sp. SP2-10]